MRLLPIAIALTLAAACMADVITLKNGRVINGTYLGGTSRQVRIEVAGQVETLEISDVARIEFGDGGSSTAVPRSTAPASDDSLPTLRRAGPAASSGDSGQPTLRRASPPVSSDDSDRPTLRRADSSASSTDPAADDPDRPVLKRTTTILRPDDDNSVSSSSNAPPPPRAPVELPPGTNIVVRMIDPVDSSTAQAGQTFRASVSDALTYNGMTLVARGADAVVKLVDAHESGKVSGHADLTLSLWSIRVDGKMVDVNTQTITKQSGFQGEHTGKMAGGAAVAGAVIGAIAGGGKGAAIGAASGAAAGTGVAAVTTGQQVKVPSETLLTFSLENSVTI